MAERRMFAKSVIGSDAFLDLPMSARLLYYDLAMRADDDGFVNAPKTIMRMVGAAPADLEALTEARFLLAFENGIVAIRHWKAHNYIRKDRYAETPYTELKSRLETDKTNAYRLLPEKPEERSPDENTYQQNGQPLVAKRSTQDRSESEIEPEIEPETETEKNSSLPASPASSAAGFSLPTKEKKEYFVGETMIDEYRSLWPELDMGAEFSAMRSWLLANPDRRKSPAETPRFVYGWLNRSHERARASPPAQWEAQRRANGYTGGGNRHTPSYDIKLAMEQMKTTVPKLKKKQKTEI